MDIQKSTFTAGAEELAQIVLESGGHGPTVCLVGGLHGDEVGAIAVIHDLINKLKSTPLTNGKLVALPLVNPAGFAARTRNVPKEGVDLNRLFPNQSPLAEAIFKQVLAHQPDLVIDLHNDWQPSIPYVILEEGQKRTELEPLAHASGLAVVAEAPDAAPSGTLSGALAAANLAPLTLELGGSYFVDESEAEIGWQTLWRLFIKMGLAPAIELKTPFPLPPVAQNRILQYADEPRVNCLGLVRFLAEPGLVVESGQPLARVSNVWGEIEETLLAPAEALLLGHADFGAVAPGDEVLALGLL